MTDYSKITALYSRLSVGDEDRDGGESNSIQNQKIFLENYARGQHLTNIRHYIDDDESGRFFDRSAYAFVLRRAELSRKNGWADEYGRVYLYYPICEVVALLRCGRQKAVNTLRELQYAGLVEIQKQGCGKPNRIYPKSYEAVPNTDFKKSGYGTPED